MNVNSQQPLDKYRRLQPEVTNHVMQAEEADRQCIKAQLMSGVLFSLRIYLILVILSDCINIGTKRPSRNVLWNVMEINGTRVVFTYYWGFYLQPNDNLANNDDNEAECSLKWFYFIC